MLFTIISLALIPVIILILFLYFTDRHDREPVRLLSKVFLFGILSAIPVLAMQFVLVRFNVFVGIFGIMFQSFVVAGLTEEYMKRLVVLKIAFRHPAFNEKLDGIIYCAMAALGFAAIENVLYLLSYYPANQSIALYRAVFSVPAHMLFAVTMGYYLSMSRFACEPLVCRSYFKKSLVYPVLLHGTYNFILYTGLPLLLVFIPFVIFMWVYNMKKLNRFYRESRDNHS